MRTLGVRGAKILEGGAETPKGFHLYCDDCVGLLTCDTFATTAYLGGGNTLRGHSSVVARNRKGKPTARAVLISNSDDDVLQKGGRDRVTARVNYASDRLFVPASEVRSLYVGDLLQQVDDEAVRGSIYAYAKELLAGNRSGIESLAVNTKTTSVQFFLGDDYPCVVSGTIFFDSVGLLSRRTILLTTDVGISYEMLSAALETETKDSFGLLTMPTSPNDGYLFLSSGLAENNKIVHRDVEFSKFSKAVEFVLLELLRKCMCGDNERDALSLQVTGAKSKRMASDVVRNAYAYFHHRKNENASLVSGLLSCAGAAGTFRRDKLRIWIQTEKRKILLLDCGRVLYIQENILSDVLMDEEIIILLDFQEGNYSAFGYINRLEQKILFS